MVFVFQGRNLNILRAENPTDQNEHQAGGWVPAGRDQGVGEERARSPELQVSSLSR